MFKVITSNETQNRNLAHFNFKVKAPEHVVQFLPTFSTSATVSLNVIAMSFLVKQQFMHYANWSYGEVVKVLANANRTVRQKCQCQTNMATAV